MGPGNALSFDEQHAKNQTLPDGSSVHFPTKRTAGIIALFTGAVLCAGAGSLPAAAAGLTFHAADRAAVAELGAVVSFPTTITNTGAGRDTFTVVISAEMDPQWVSSLCEGALCYPPFIRMISVVLDPGQDTIMDVDITPLGEPGGGRVHVAVTSGVDPGQAADLDFAVVTPGLDALVVADDDGAGLESWYISALAAAGRSCAVWPRSWAGALGQLDLAGFGTVIWFTGPSTAGLESADLGTLAYSVQHGGRLLLSGQDVAWAGCDPASPAWSPATAAWFAGILGAGFAATAGGNDQVGGVIGDPVGNGWLGSLAGGTGAGGNSSPDAITANGGQASLVYGNGAVAAVRNFYGAGRSYFCGFGWENLATDGEREGLLNAVLAWFDAPSAAPDTPPRLAVDLHPNPFNPAVTIAWELPRPGPLRISVHDLAGRHLATLHDGPAPAGPGTVSWRGLAANGRALPSGVYLCRFEQNGEVTSRKVTLAR